MEGIVHYDQWPRPQLSIPISLMSPKSFHLIDQYAEGVRDATRAVDGRGQLAPASKVSIINAAGLKMDPLISHITTIEGDAEADMIALRTLRTTLGFDQSVQFEAAFEALRLRIQARLDASKLLPSLPGGTPPATAG